MKIAISSVGTVLALAAAASAQSLITGPSSSATPYVRAVTGGPALDIVSILTVGDSVNLRADGITPYRFAGIPDGMGAYDNGDGTMTVFVNHEFTNTAASGFVRQHQVGTGASGGAFVSRWVIRTTPGADFLRVVNGQDLMNSVVTSTNGSGGLYTFNRFCSADLASQQAFFNAASGLGTTERIFLTGEESGTTGRMVAIGAVERIGEAVHPLRYQADGGAGHLLGVVHERGHRLAQGGLAVARCQVTQPLRPNLLGGLLRRQIAVALLWRAGVAGDQRQHALVERPGLAQQHRRNDQPLLKQFGGDGHRTG